MTLRSRTAMLPPSQRYFIATAPPPPCPEGIDPAVFDSLPIDVRRELANVDPAGKAGGIGRTGKRRAGGGKAAASSVDYQDSSSDGDGDGKVRDDEDDDEGTCLSVVLPMRRGGGDGDGSGSSGVIDIGLGKGIDPSFLSSVPDDVLNEMLFREAQNRAWGQIQQVQKQQQQDSQQPQPSQQKKQNRQQQQQLKDDQKKDHNIKDDERVAAPRAKVDAKAEGTEKRVKKIHNFRKVQHLQQQHQQQEQEQQQQQQKQPRQKPNHAPKNSEESNSRSKSNVVRSDNDGLKGEEGSNANVSTNETTLASSSAARAISASASIPTPPAAATARSLSGGKPPPRNAPPSLRRDARSASAGSPSAAGSASAAGAKTPADYQRMVADRPLRLPNDSAEYRGDYNGHGERHGMGVWINRDRDNKPLRYEGTFVNGWKEGQGKYTMGDGSIYEGEFKKDKFVGEGRMTYSDGNIYDGDFDDGQRHGQGKCNYKNGDNYTGQWDKGIMRGQGRYYFRNEANFQKAFPKNSKYGHYGDFKFSPDGNIRYEGYWDGGMPNGRGKYYLTEGKILEGSFWNGKRHGPGKYTKRDGTMEVCNFDQNVQKGEGVRWSPDRKKAWRVQNGKVKKHKTISAQAAAVIAESCGYTSLGIEFPTISFTN